MEAAEPDAVGKEAGGDEGAVVFRSMADREEIIRFIEEQLGFTPTPKTKFFWGTGVAGLDAWAFMDEFADRYDVNMDGVGSDVDYGDSDTPLADVFDRLWKRFRFQRVAKTGHFTIDHLVEVANRKEWFDPPA